MAIPDSEGDNFLWYQSYYQKSALVLVMNQKEINQCFMHAYWYRLDMNYEQS